MGITGSMTAKADIQSCFSTFTTWEMNAVCEMFYRSEYELADSFALCSHEFELLIGLQSHSEKGENIAEILQMRKYGREVFKLFETRKGICDKYEVLCAITFLSAVSSETKVALLFELFNFNKKGYLLPNEISLLLLSAINAAKMVDKLLNIIDVSIAIGRLVQVALQKYALVNPMISIRKPEFILFSKESRKVEAFLDVWRGRIGHVVIPDNTLWEDPYFDAAESSIVPSKGWQVKGLPPKGFVHWLRLSDMRADAGVIGRTTLFDNTLELSRTVKARGFLTGCGALARGYLKQGLIADRYLLNGLAVCLSCPSVIQRIFTPTKQETLGRYCVKIFEGGGWRSVFIDDRVPCTPSGVPSFCNSSDPFEGWPLLLEKAFAKYLGSYGHVADYSSRLDASLTALRLLTGGHVYRQCTYNLTWKSGFVTRIDRDGFGILKGMLAEGSLVAFGRSEVLALGKPPLRDTPQELCPHGRLFPVVGITYPDAECSYSYVVLKDSWNIIASDDSTQAPDEESGHYRTFRMKLEEVPTLFDCLVVCRYPDVLRSERLAAYEIKKKIKVPPKSSTSSGGDAYKAVGQPWQTEIVRNKTFGTLDPARFRLVVRDIDSVFENDLKLDPEASEKSLSLPFGAALASSSGADNMLVDIAITVSSSFDWAASGAADAGAKVRFRIVPLRKTHERAVGRKDQLKARALYQVEKQLRIEAQIMAELKEQEMNEKEASRMDSEKENSLSQTNEVGMAEKKKEEEEKKVEKKEEKETGVEATSDAKEGDSVPFLSAIQKKSSMRAKPTEQSSPGPVPVEEEIEEEGGVYSFGCEGSWVSAIPLFLYPGEYNIFADVSYEASTESLKRGLKSPLEVRDAPWVEDILYGHPAVWLQCTAGSIGRMELSEGIKPSPPVVTLSDSMGSSSGDSDEEDSYGYQTPSESQKTLETKGSTVSFEGVEDEEGLLADLSTIIVPPSTWPFTTEVQSEIASAGLYSMLADLRGEAEELASEFICAARRFNKVKKIIH